VVFEDIEQLGFELRLVLVKGERLKAKLNQTLVLQELLEQVHGCLLGEILNVQNSEHFKPRRESFKDLVHAVVRHVFENEFFDRTQVESSNVELLISSTIQSQSGWLAILNELVDLLSKGFILRD